MVQVELGPERSYPIFIGPGLLERRPELLAPHLTGQVLIVTNDTVASLHLEAADRAIRAALEAAGTRDGGGDPARVEHVCMPDGEEHKTLDVLERYVFDALLRNRFGRGCTLVALGGGVVGDMCGFAAASYQRGCKFVQIPTTVMAMVDSSVGGKTGVNHARGKNMIGAFHQPQCVFVDTDTLATLPARELASGLAEVVKYGLIRDAEFFRWQEENMARLLSRDPEAMSYAIQRSCVNKAEVVAADEHERSSGGGRATLNLGHTFGHAIETGCGYGAYLHGEAVAMGMGMAADLSVRLGWIDEALRGRVERLLLDAGLATSPPPDALDAERFLELMAVDKKNVGGKIRFILLKGDLGGCVFTGDFDQGKLMETLHKYTAAAEGASGSDSESAFAGAAPARAE